MQNILLLSFLERSNNRLGQSRNVLVYRLLCKDTVDEKIVSILKEKQKIFNDFADISEAAKLNNELDDKTFKDIIQEEIDRVRLKNRIEV